MFSELDPRSLIFVAGLLALLCSGILLVLRYSFPETIRGLLQWSTGCLSMISASVLFGLTGRIPDLFSVVLANTMLVGGVILVSLGFVYFLARRINIKIPLVILLLVTCAVSWYTYVYPSYPARAMLVSGTDSAIFLACCALLFRRAWNSPAGCFTGAVFLMIGIVSAARVVILLAEADIPTNVFSASNTQKTYLAALAFSILAITLGAIMMANEQLRKALEFIASHDTLSGAYARGAFIDLLQKELARVQRARRPLALLMCDLDSFKSINDRFGHMVGDRVIVDFSQKTMALLRKQDFLGRYGGEEFIVLLPDTTLDEAAIVAERLRTSVAESGSSALPAYTVSIGVGSTTDGDIEVDTLLSETDRALYRAKANGRNRVELADSLMPADAMPGVDEEIVRKIG